MEFECALLRDGYNQFSTQSNTGEDEFDLHKIENSWHLLFPEVVQGVNTVGNNLNRLPLSHQEDTPVISIDAIDGFPPSVLTDRLELNHKSVLSLVESSYDLILVDIGLRNQTTSSTIAPLQDDDIHREFENEESITSTDYPKTEDSYFIYKFSLPPQSPSPMHSPPVQVMEKDIGYDPQRIPSSVFARNDSRTRVDWSAASNDSLFSLNVGNTSMGRDQALMLSRELNKLEGLPKSGDLGDLSKLAGLSKSNELLMLCPPSPTISMLEDEGEVQSVKSSKEKTVAIVETKKEISNINPVKIDKEKKQERLPSMRSSSASNQSDGIKESTCSFAHPIKKKKNVFRRKKFAWPSCDCFKCSWPRCCCSNCSWAFCYHWNSNYKRLVGHNDERYSNQDEEVTSAMVAPNSGGCFSCFSCLLRCPSRSSCSSWKSFWSSCW